MKRILVAAAGLVLAGGTSVFAGGPTVVSGEPAVSADCTVDANNDCMVAAGPVSSGDGLLLGGLGAPVVVGGIAVLALVAAVSANGSTNNTN